MSTEIEKRAEEIGKEPAYPVVEPNTPCSVSLGLTKLELFAGMAMQGMLANPRTDENTMETIADHSLLLAKALCYALAEAEMKEVSNG